MHYLLLLYHDPKHLEARKSDPELMAKVVGEHRAYAEEMKAAGAFVGGNALQGVETATTVRKAGSDYTLTDGPFAETKELLGGYYLIDAANLDEALAWAKKNPEAKYGSVECRPIWEHADRG